MPDGFKNKKVLVFGLGILGGGVATTNWLLEQGARVTVTDLKNSDQLEPSVRRIEAHLKKISKDGKAYEKARTRLVWALGGHTNQLVDDAEIIVVNPDVSERNPYIQRALKKGKKVINEGTIFFDNWRGSIIGVTGTRGKTTTTNWIHYFVQPSVIAGNSMTKPFLAVLGETDKKMYAVTELPSFILEGMNSLRAPHVAVITNIFRDHLNRHGTMNEYVQAKARIFERQRESDWLVLNKDNEWTEHVIGLSPKSSVRYFSLNPLPPGALGAWYADGLIWERTKKGEDRVLTLDDFRSKWGDHNISNLLAAALAAHLAGVKWTSIQSRIESVPQVQFRQEEVYSDSRISVINDTTATSPEGGVAAVNRFGGPGCVLITGGTDRELDYRQWAEVVKKKMRKNDIVFLQGSATQKMRQALGIWAEGIRAYEDLQDAVQAAFKRARFYVKSKVLFSPASKSFEMFDNEYDRGRKFNEAIKKWIKL